MNIFIAIEQGYKYAVFSGGTIQILLSDIIVDSGLYANYHLVLCEKEPQFHSLDDLDQLIIDKLEDQEDYYSNNGFAMALDGCDDLLKQLQDKINDNLKNKPFYIPTKITLRYD